MMARMRRIRLTRTLSVIGFAFLLLGLFAYLTHELRELPSTTVLPLDAFVLGKAQSLRSFGLTRYFLEITALGSASVLTTLTVVILSLLACAGLWRGFTQLLLVGLATPLLSSGLKNFAGRARPAVEVRLDYVSSFTFPSGHSLAASAIYLTIAFLLLPLIRSARLQVVFLTFACLLVFLIGLSRLYLGVHYLSDVGGGLCVGTGFACLAHVGFNTLWNRSRALKKLDHVS